MIYLRNGLLCLLALIVLMGIYGKRGVMDYVRLKSQSQQFEKKLLEAKIQKEFLDFQLESIKKDKQTQERIVREVLGYVKPNETIIEFQ